MPGWEQVSRTLTRDYTFDINRTSSSESTHNLRLRVAPPGSAPAASSRLPRSVFTVTSHPRLAKPGQEFPAPVMKDAGTHRNPAHIHRI